MSDSFVCPQGKRVLRLAARWERCLLLPLLLFVSSFAHFVSDVLCEGVEACELSLFTHLTFSKERLIVLFILVSFEDRLSSLAAPFDN